MKVNNYSYLLCKYSYTTSIGDEKAVATSHDRATLVNYCSSMFLATKMASDEVEHRTLAKLKIEHLYIIEIINVVPDVVEEDRSLNGPANVLVSDLSYLKKKYVGYEVKYDNRYKIDYVTLVSDKWYRSNRTFGFQRVIDFEQSHSTNASSMSPGKLPAPPRPGTLSSRNVQYYAATPHFLAYVAELSRVFNK